MDNKTRKNKTIRPRNEDVRENNVLSENIDGNRERGSPKLQSIEITKRKNAA